MDSGQLTWAIVATAMVLFMTPGLAFFYGGMVRAKNVLGMLMQNFFAMGLMAIIWVAIAFSLAFGNFGDGGFIGSTQLTVERRDGTSWTEIGTLTWVGNDSKAPVIPRCIHPP